MNNSEENNNVNLEEELVSQENACENEESIIGENETTEEKSKKKSTSFDEKVDSTADFIKKHKIKILCGIIAVLALVIGILIGVLAGGKDDSSQSASNEGTSVVATVAPESSTTPQATQSAVSTETPTVSDGETALEESAQAEDVVVYYADLLDSVVYFEESIDFEMSQTELCDLLNLVLQVEESEVSASGVLASDKVAMSDTISTDVSKADMLAFLQDTNATFSSITQSVSGDVLTLAVNMNIEIPEDIMTEAKDSNFLVSLALSAFSSNISFSYTVKYDMDGETLSPIEVSDSTVSIAGQNSSMTETIASIVLASYSDISADELLVAYNNKAGEIIADILNNYAIVNGATSSGISMTTRTK